MPDHERQFVYHGVPTVMYHQEFSLDYFRHEWPPSSPNIVASFVNCLPETGPPYDVFKAFATTMRDLDWRVYGAYGSAPLDEYAAGDISLVPQVGQLMRDSRIGFHSKVYSDGYGHVIHSWGAVGRPVIGVESYYRDKLAAPLFQEGVTTFAIDRHSFDEMTMLIRRLIDDDELHHRMSEAMAARFRQYVSFDADAEAVRRLMESVA